MTASWAFEPGRWNESLAGVGYDVKIAGRKLLSLASAEGVIESPPNSASMAEHLAILSEVGLVERLRGGGVRLTMNASPVETRTEAA